MNLQTFLVQRGYFRAAPTGYYGALTKIAVQKYQCDKAIVCQGTESTTGFGMVGAKTRAAFAREEQGTLVIPQTSPSVQTPQTSASKLIAGNLSLDSRNSDVLKLQQFLISQKLLSPEFMTGYFGQKTRAALIVFQAIHQIPPTGYFGPLTRGVVNGMAGNR